MEKLWKRPFLSGLFFYLGDTALLSFFNPELAFISVSFGPGEQPMLWYGLCPG